MEHSACHNVDILTSGEIVCQIQASSKVKLNKYRRAWAKTKYKQRKGKHTHTHTKPPAFSPKNHRSQNQKGPQKIQKDWQDAQPCIPLPIVEMTCLQILFGAIRKIVSGLPCQIFILCREVKYRQTYMKKVVADQD